MKKLFFMVLGSLLAGQMAAADSKVFKMYTSPHVDVNPSCQRYVELTLDVNAESGTGTALLVNRLSGFCELYVAPNPRSYKITVRGEYCGTRVYTHEDSTQAPVVLVDNRHRDQNCPPSPQAALILTEYTVHGSPEVLYSESNR